MLQSCDNLPTTNAKVDPNQAIEIFNQFIVVRRLGNNDKGGFYGASSIVVEMTTPKPNTAPIAVKMMILEDISIHDLKIACQLNGLHNFTPFFIRTHGWFLINGIPELWYDTLEEYPSAYNHNTLLCQAMDKSTNRFDDKSVKLSEAEFKSVLFIMLHGLDIAIKSYGFMHGDLHSEQVLLHIVYEKEIILRTMEEEEIVIEISRFCPKLIDFGLSSTIMHPDLVVKSPSKSYSTSSDSLFEKDSDDEFDDFIPKDDIERILEIIHTKMVSQLKKKAYKHLFTPQSLNRFETMILKNKSRDINVLLYESGYFNDIIKQRRQKTAIQQHCMVCHSEARLEWKNTEYIFCSERCSDYWYPIRKIVPFISYSPRLQSPI